MPDDAAAPGGGAGPGTDAAMTLVLVTPEIPGNTGTIGRTCLALGMELALIRPYGFALTDKTVRRAGLDYWKHVRLSEHDSWDGFLAARRPRRGQVFLFEDDGAAGTVFEPDYPPDAILVFGRETTGLPPEITGPWADRLYRLPMRPGPVRSLNLANAATAAAYQAMRTYLA